MDIANIGAALGGASQGVGQGLDLYTKYQQVQEENRKRENQQKAAGKLQEMAKTGILQNNPQQAMREYGDFFGSLGDADNMQKYHAAADDLRKKGAQRAGLMVSSIAGVSPQATMDPFNDYYKQMGINLKAEYVGDPTGGGFTIKGMGADPVTGQHFANAEEFHDAALHTVAPGVFSEPKDALEFERMERKGRADVRLEGAQTTDVESQTGERNTLLDPRKNLLTAQGVDVASQTNERNTLLGPRKGQLLATTADIQSQTGERDYLRPLRGAQISAATDYTASQTTENQYLLSGKVRKLEEDIGLTHNTALQVATAVDTAVRSLPYDLAQKAAATDLTKEQAGRIQTLLSSELRQNLAQAGLTEAQINKVVEDTTTSVMERPIKLAQGEATLAETRGRIDLQPTQKANLEAATKQIAANTADTLAITPVKVAEAKTRITQALQDIYYNPKIKEATLQKLAADFNLTAAQTNQLMAETDRFIQQSPDIIAQGQIGTEMKRTEAMAQPAQQQAELEGRQAQTEQAQAAAASLRQATAQNQRMGPLEELDKMMTIGKNYQAMRAEPDKLATEKAKNEALIRYYDAAAGGKGKKVMDALKPFIRDPDVAGRVPFEYDPANLAPIAIIGAADTGASLDDTAASASKAVRSWRDEWHIDYNAGTIKIGNETITLGKNGVKAAEEMQTQLREMARKQAAGG